MEHTHTERESMVFYKSFFEAIEDLPGEEFKKCASAILNYGLNGILPETTGFEKAIMTLVKPQIDKNNQRWMSAKKSHSAKSAPDKKDSGQKEVQEVHNKEPLKSDEPIQNLQKDRLPQDSAGETQTLSEYEKAFPELEVEKLGEYKNVLLTPGEIEVLKDELGMDRYRDSVRFLSKYMKRKPDYKSGCHFEDLRGWVQDAVDKQKKNVKKPRNPSFDFDFEDIFEIP